MSGKVIQLKTLLGGVEDLLLDASSPDSVTQQRSGNDVIIHKINLKTIPAVGKLGDSNFKSLKTYIDEQTNLGDQVFVSTSDGSIGLVVGDGGLTWEGGTPASNKISLAQKLSNGKYRWLGQGTSGSDNWTFRGRVAGQNAVNDNDFVTKAQLDSKAVQSDWHQGNSSHPAFIRNKPCVQCLSYATTSTAGKVEAGTDEELNDGTSTTPMGWTAKQLKDFSEANSGGGDALLAINGSYHTGGVEDVPPIYLGTIVHYGEDDSSSGTGNRYFSKINSDGTIGDTLCTGNYFWVFKPKGSYTVDNKTPSGTNGIEIKHNGDMILDNRDALGTKIDDYPITFDLASDGFMGFFATGADRIDITKD